MDKLIQTAINDFRLIFRDNSLKIFLLLPVLNLLVVRYGFPYVVNAYDVVRDHLAIILMFATMQGSTAFGFIYSMVLVDEKDTSVAKVYGILPVSKFGFVVFRLVPPFILATLSSFLLLLAEPFYGVPALSNLAYSILAGLVAPTMALIVAVIAKNKIEAMTWQKLFSLPLYLPVVAFFLPYSLSLIFMVYPAYWAYQGFNAVVNGANPWLFVSIGILYSIVLLGLLVRRFTLTHFR